MTELLIPSSKCIRPGKNKICTLNVKGECTASIDGTCPIQNKKIMEVISQTPSNDDKEYLNKNEIIKKIISQISFTEDECFLPEEVLFCPDFENKSCKYEYNPDCSILWEKIEAFLDQKADKI